MLFYKCLLLRFMLPGLYGEKLESYTISSSVKQLNGNIDFNLSYFLDVPHHSINVECLEDVAADLQQLFLLTHSILYLLRKPVFAAVINNLEVSPSMQSFKSTQLAAWLSPLHSKSVMRGPCRLLVTTLPSDHTSLLAFVMFCCRKIHCGCILNGRCFRS